MNAIQLTSNIIILIFSQQSRWQMQTKEKKTETASAEDSPTCEHNFFLTMSECFNNVSMSIIGPKFIANLPTVELFRNLFLNFPTLPHPPGFRKINLFTQ